MDMTLISRGFKYATVLLMKPSPETLSLNDYKLCVAKAMTQIPICEKAIKTVIQQEPDFCRPDEVTLETIIYWKEVA